jgi:hypothetical protein
VWPASRSCGFTAGQGTSWLAGELVLKPADLLAVRNQRILAAFDARQADNTRRAALGLPPRTRKRRRRTLAILAASPP